MQISASNVFAGPVATKIISPETARSQNFVVRFLVADASFLDSSSAGYYLRAWARNVLGTGPYSAVVFTVEFSFFAACLPGFYMTEAEGSGTCEPCPAFGQSVILLVRMLIIRLSSSVFILIQSQRTSFLALWQCSHRAVQVHKRLAIQVQMGKFARCVRIANTTIPSTHHIQQLAHFSY